MHSSISASSWCKSRQVVILNWPTFGQWNPLATNIYQFPPETERPTPCYQSIEALLTAAQLEIAPLNIGNAGAAGR